MTYFASSVQSRSFHQVCTVTAHLSACSCHHGHNVSSGKPSIWRCTRLSPRGNEPHATATADTFRCRHKNSRHFIRRQRHNVDGTVLVAHQRNECRDGRVRKARLARCPAPRAGGPNALGLRDHAPGNSGSDFSNLFSRNPTGGACRLGKRRRCSGMSTSRLSIRRSMSTVLPGRSSRVSAWTVG